MFDRSLILRRLSLRQASQGGDEPAASFLLDRVAGDMIDRLAMTGSSYPRIIDLGTPSLQLARQLYALSPAPSLTRVFPLPENAGAAWTQQAMDMESARLEPISADLVVSALALQCVNDLPALLMSIRKALRPGGLFLACLVGGQSLQELRTVLTMAQAQISGGASPRVIPCVDLRDAAGLMQQAGFVRPVADMDRLTIRYRDLFALIADIRQMGAGNPLVSTARRPLHRTIIPLASALYAQHFSDPDGRIRATLDLLWLHGRVPQGA